MYVVVLTLLMSENSVFIVANTINGPFILSKSQNIFLTSFKRKIFNDCVFVGNVILELKYVLENEVG